MSHTFDPKPQTDFERRMGIESCAICGLDAHTCAMVASTEVDA